ncbi:MAG: glycosyltransferase family 4 protein [Casimicrobiaceae bacterium]
MHVSIIGPVAPPYGGMAGQTRQLCDLLLREGVATEIVRTNSPARPPIVERLRGVRALFRLVPYLWRLWGAAGRSSVFHVMANSGWAWHLFAAPAIWIGKLRGARVVVNYRGGAAEGFLATTRAPVLRTLRLADAVVVPSDFLRGTFERFGVEATVVPNVVDLERFTPAHPPAAGHGAAAPQLVIARNLEPIYDLPTAIRAFAIVQAAKPTSRLAIAGSGPERTTLGQLVAELGLSAAVDFRGALSRDAMADLYRGATLLVNSSTVDNTPNSLLEAMASGVPIVSTNVGGVPYLVQDGTTALLVPPGNCEAMAKAMLAVLDDPVLARRLSDNGLQQVRCFAWDRVHPLWMRAYGRPVDQAYQAPAAPQAGEAR